MEQLAQHNPWWHNPSWGEEDAHLREFSRSAAPWIPGLIKEFELEEERIYTLRGPRQVGKTTLQKLLIRQALKTGHEPGRVLYLDCERAGFDSHPRLRQSVEDFLDGLRKKGGKGGACVFLDEVTSVRDWAAALKVLADAGKLKGCCVVATGSHAVDLKKGGERMPGRRGEASGLDKILLPMSFREWLSATQGGSKPPGSALADLRAAEAVYSAAASLENGRLIQKAFEVYLLTGGYPRAVASFKKESAVAAYVYEIYQEALLGTVRRLGHRESYFRELFAHWLRVQPNPLDWRDVSRETDIGKHDTVREYAEDLELAYFWDIAFRSQTLGNPRPAFRSPKKIFIKDPFSFHTLRAWALGFPDPWEASRRMLRDPVSTGALVESVAGSHLKRRFGPFLHYWRNKREVDFLGFAENRLKLAAESRYSDEPSPEALDALGAIGGGILLSRAELRWDPTRGVAVVPAGLFLSLL